MLAANCHPQNLVPRNAINCAEVNDTNVTELDEKPATTIPFCTRLSLVESVQNNIQLCVCVIEFLFQFLQADP